MTCAIFGFFASVWFGWAQEDPPMAWEMPLTIGAVIGIGFALVCGIFAYLNWHSGSILNNETVFRKYLIIVGIEFGVALLGALVLLLSGNSIYLSPWICLLVGVHLWPMAAVLQNSGLYVLSIALSVMALGSVPIASNLNITISAVTGAGAGTLLILFSVWSALLLTI